MNWRKQKHRGPAAAKPVDLRSRIDRAITEGRFQQALELTKQLFKQEPTPAHRALLHEVYLGRAAQLRGQGQTRDALTTLHAALQPAGLLPEWKQQIAEAMAGCGNARGALDLLATEGDDALRARILALAADAALGQESAGRATLPESMHAEFDAVLRAFKQLEAGQDEAAKESLQAVGLRSPFLEWKLLLRGLQAYYQKDDARAVENWQRLSPDRLPARLIAPLRFAIDPAFRQAQPAVVQPLLQKRNQRLQGDGTARQLREVQSALVNNATMSQVFRQAEAALATLRQETPHLVPRLAVCLYWAILNHGMPEDVPRYQRIFGSPPDDRAFHRLNALGWERAGDFALAHKHWQQYEKEVAGHPEVWPGDQATRVRALVWQHMGRNAASIPDESKMALLPPFLRDHPSRPKALKPTAEECFRKSIQLAPDSLGPYEDLFFHYRDTEKTDKAVRIARELLARSPDHVETLVELGELLLKQQDYAEALTSFQRAFKNNPLDRRLRGAVSTAHIYNARANAEAGRFDDARAEFQAALALSEADNNSAVYCKWSACEFKAGDRERGEELLQKALAQEGNHLAVNYGMLIETIRLKLPGPFKTRFNKAFNEGLAEQPTGAAAAALADTTASHEVAGVTYHGQKTHQKKVFDYLKKAIKSPFTEGELERVCQALLPLRTYRLAKQYAELGKRKFPKAPVFPLCRARNEMARGPGQFYPYEVRTDLELAEKLAEKLPPDRKQEELLEEIHTRLQAVDVFNPFGQLFGGGLDPFDFFGGEDDDEDDDFYDGF